MTAIVPPVLAVLRPGTGPELAPLDQPVLRAHDLAATRGDGVFETMHVRPAGAWLLDAHLRRLAGSAAALGLALPEKGELVDVVAAAVAGWQSGHAVGEPDVAEAGVKLVCSRGPEYAPELGPTAYALTFEIPENLIAQRRKGIALGSLSFGYPVAERSRAPWLLGGAKTLSYATNMAALRRAALDGYDDVLLTSADGYVLEGPTSTVVWAIGDVLHTVPTDTGVLASVTVGYLFDNARRVGLRTCREMVTLPELASVDGVWLCSSVRGIVEATSLNGEKLAHSGLTPKLAELLGFPA